MGNVHSPGNLKVHTPLHVCIGRMTARHAGATTAQDVARMFALQWHQDGLAPYIVFEGKTDHGDGETLSAQECAWAKLLSCAPS